jgi:hypothetical protein
VSLTFLSPAAVLVFLGCSLPLAALLKARARARDTRSAIGLREPPRGWYLVPVAALVGAATFVGLAAAQPVVEFDRTTRVRTDAEAFIVLDITRSMLAKKEPSGTSRLSRAKALALALRQTIPAVPVGLGSVTDRTLPYLFPTADEESFRATLAQSVGIERPPPLGGFLSRATKLESLASVVTQGFYSPKARNRALVVLTDGETLPATQERLGSLFRRPPGVRAVFIQVWAPDERVFAGRLPESGYRPDPTARAELERFAAEIDGAVFSERELGAAKQAVREIVGKGPTVVRGERRDHVALAPYLAGAAFLPLVLLLWRRDR